MRSVYPASWPGHSPWNTAVNALTPGHPRLVSRLCKSWMPGTSPGHDERCLLPPLHRPFELGLRRAFRPHQLILLRLELDQISRGENVLAGLVVLHAAIAHHQLLGLKVGR